MHPLPKLCCWRTGTRRMGSDLRARWHHAGRRHSRRRSREDGKGNWPPSSSLVVSLLASALPAAMTTMILPRTFPGVWQNPGRKIIQTNFIVACPNPHKSKCIWEASFQLWWYSSPFPLPRSYPSCSFSLPPPSPSPFGIGTFVGKKILESLQPKRAAICGTF